MSLVFHGHAHRGRAEGATASGAAVYNVSLPLLTRLFSDRPPFRVFNVTVAETSKRDIPIADAEAPLMPAAASASAAGGGRS